MTSVASYIICITTDLLTYLQPMFTAKYTIDSPGGRSC